MANRYIEFMEDNSQLFPWSSDSEKDSDATVSPPPTTCHASKRRSQEVRTLLADGIHFLQPSCERLLSGKALQHCVSMVERIRVATGGEALALFKIGITHDFDSRFGLYRENGWQKMGILFQTFELRQIEMLEAALILHFKRLQQCRNIQKGGEGMRTAAFNAKFPAPYYCYCVAARADCGHSVI